MPALFSDLAHLLDLYFIVRRSKEPGMEGLPSISIGDIESAYRMYEANEWISPAEFAATMFELDSVSLERYRELHPPKP